MELTLEVATAEVLVDEEALAAFGAVPDEGDDVRMVNAAENVDLHPELPLLVRLSQRRRRLHLLDRHHLRAGHGR